VIDIDEAIELKALVERQNDVNDRVARAMIGLEERLDSLQAQLAGITKALNGATGPHFALSREAAAAAMGMSLDSFERYVQPDVRLVRRGRMRLVPPAELERWVEVNAERVLP
jgi:hypothetical protein